jgi:hypothetical protein
MRGFKIVAHCFETPTGNIGKWKSGCFLYSDGKGTTFWVPMGTDTADLHLFSLRRKFLSNIP